LKSTIAWSLLAIGASVPGWSQPTTFTIRTVAGNGNGGDSGDGVRASSAELDGPRGVTEDIYGNLYIAEFYGQRVRKVTPGGTITTIAELAGPYRVSVDLQGNVYIPDSGNSRVRKVSPSYVGLYQFDVAVPNVAAGNAVPVTFTLGGVSGTQTLNLAVGN
jgi:hypothetical protein